MNGTSSIIVVYKSINTVLLCDVSTLYTTMELVTNEWRSSTEVAWCWRIDICTKEAYQTSKKYTITYFAFIIFFRVGYLPFLQSNQVKKVSSNKHSDMKYNESNDIYTPGNPDCLNRSWAKKKSMGVSCCSAFRGLIKWWEGAQYIHCRYICFFQKMYYARYTEYM